MPLIGWKNYWYGQNSIINLVADKNKNHEEMVVNLRFDILNNSNSFEKNKVTKFIMRNVYNSFTRNIFIANYKIYGIDNIYIGNISTMKKLINHFHNSLDVIMKKNLRVENQEYLVFSENNLIF